MTSQAQATRRPLSFGENLFAGGCAGVTELYIIYPLDVVKTRVQMRVK